MGGTVTKIFYDTEFYEDGKTIDLISIGMVSQSGREFYAVSNEFDTRRVAANNWLMDNVMSSIEHEKFVVTDFQGAKVVRDIHVTDPAAMSREAIKYGIWDFIGAEKDAELWAWYSAYDHVCLAQLFGKMIDLPRAVPMYTNDLKTLVNLAGNPTMPRQPSGLHNALDDARMNLVRYNFLEGILNAKDAV